MKNYIVCTTALMLCLMPSAADAQDKDALHGYVAGGVFATTDYEGSSNFQAVPLLSGKVGYNHYYIETRGLGLRANISPTPDYDFGPVVSYKMSRDDDIDNNRVASLREVDDALELGAFLKIPITGVTSNPYDQLSFDLEILGDATDAYDGYQVSVGTSYSYPISRALRVSTSLSTTYADDNYMQTYFGVDADNAARSGLGQYQADGGFKDVGLNFVANYGLSKNWGLIGIIGYNRLIGDAANSPLVEDEGSANQFRVGTGLTYRF